MRPETFAAMAATPTVCEHLHYPLQSGSDRILAAMHRGYTAERYLERLVQARASVADLAVSTDIIVGFPGETDDDFARTLEVAAAAEYDYAYTFIFSPRDGTEAATMADRFVDPAVVAERFERLRVVVERSAIAKHRDRIGRIEEVLVEGPSKSAQKAALGDSGNGDSFIPRDTSLQPVSDLAKPLVSLPSPSNPADIEQTYEPIQLTGRTMCDRIVVFPGSLRLAGGIARVTIEDCTPTTLTGRMVTYETAGGLLPVLMTR
jgi:tRNA A37 methylthiotransferase MiaB